MRLPDPEEHPLLTVEEAGAYFGRKRGAAYLMVQRGELPVLRCGGRIYVPTAALRRLLQLDPPVPASTEAEATG